jgi:hypothetical protein
VWQLLHLPVVQKLDMVIKYTSRDMAPLLEVCVPLIHPL